MPAAKPKFRRSPTSPRAWVWLTLFAGAMGATCAAASAGDLISQEEALRHGLQRAWFSHIRVDRARHEVSNWTLDENQLFALTTDGSVQATNAETGENLWVAEIAGRSGSTAGMAVNSKYVAVLSAARLYLLDRGDGRLKWSRAVGGAPSASPALSNRHAYVALLSGRVEGYDLEDTAASPWQYQSIGRSFHSPATTGNVISWPTSERYLYVGSLDSPRPLYRIRTNDEIVAAPAAQEPHLFVGSLDGYLYCFHETAGNEVWRYSTGFSIAAKPAIVGDKVFVASMQPALHALDSSNGQALWRAPGVTQFAALGTHHAYGLDGHGTLVVLDKESGGLAGRIATSSQVSAIVNEQSDRIFLVTKHGLVQCLREIGATEPIRYRGASEKDEQAEESDVSEENPFDNGDVPSTTPKSAADGDSTGWPLEGTEAEEAIEATDDDEGNPFLD